MCAQVVWTVLIEAVPTTGKNAAQIKAAILKQVKAYKSLLSTFCSSGRVEAALMVHVQVTHCLHPPCIQCERVMTCEKHVQSCGILRTTAVSAAKSWEEKWAGKGATNKQTNDLTQSMRVCPHTSMLVQKSDKG